MVIPNRSIPAEIIGKVKNIPSFHFCLRIKKDNREHGVCVRKTGTEAEIGRQREIGYVGLEHQEKKNGFIELILRKHEEKDLALFPMIPTGLRLHFHQDDLKATFAYKRK